MSSEYKAHHELSRNHGQGEPFGRIPYRGFGFPPWKFGCKGSKCRQDIQALGSNVLSDNCAGSLKRVATDQHSRKFAVKVAAVRGMNLPFLSLRLDRPQSWNRGWGEVFGLHFRR